jgi:hypothetical protein
MQIFEDTEKHGLGTKGFGFLRLDISNGVAGRVPMVENQVCGDDRGAATHTRVAVNQDTCVGGCEDSMYMTRHGAEVTRHERCPVGTVIDGDAVRGDILTEMCRDVSRAIDDETDIVFAHKPFVLGRVDGPDPDPIEDLLWGKHVYFSMFYVVFLFLV